MLRKLDHINAAGVVQLKGRAACEVDTADELLTVELMFNGTFNGLDVHQLVALVSCLVPVEKSNVRLAFTLQCMEQPLDAEVIAYWRQLMSAVPIGWLNLRKLLKS